MAWGPSVWNGHSKQITKNCEECEYFEILKKRRYYANNQRYADKGIKVCKMGIAWKILEETKKPRKCSLISLLEK